MPIHQHVFYTRDSFWAEVNDLSHRLERIIDTMRILCYNVNMSIDLNSPPNQDTPSRINPFSFATCNELL